MKLIEEENPDGSIMSIDGIKRWFKNNLLHREDGPAIIAPNGTRMWLQNGKRHRLDGPAVKWASKLHRQDEWYYHGQQIDCSSQEEFEKLLKLKAFW